MKTFSQLGSKSVKIIGANQQIHEVKRLNIAQLEQFEHLADETFKQAEIQERDGNPVAPVFREGARQLRELIKDHFPAEIRDDLFRCRFPELLALGLHLAYGDDLMPVAVGDESAEEVKKKE